MSNNPPSHDECHILKSPCWHDGTSLYAEEHYVPLLKFGDHIAIFSSMVSDAKEQFSEGKMQ